MRVVITRAENEAPHMAGHLQQKGMTPLVASMMEIETIDTPVDVAPYQGIVISSANGLRSLADSTDVRDMPLYCVGGQTDKKAQELGFTNTHYSIGNAKNLAIFIGKIVKPEEGPLLYLHGQNDDASPIQDLRRNRFQVQPRLSYRTAAVKELPPEVLAEFEKDLPPEVVTLYSIRTYKLFKEMMVKYGLVPKLAGVTAVCLSPAIADFARELRWKSVLSAAEHSGNSVIETIEGLKSRT